MGQIHEALEKVKAMRDGAEVDAAKKRRSSFDAKAKAAARPVLVGESRLARGAARIRLDTALIAENRIVASSQAPGINSAYKMLRTRILRQLRTNQWTRFAISSPRPSAGKTLTAINTAISLSFETNQRVILVDLDLRRPSIARYLGINQDKGLSDYLIDNASIEDIVVRPDLERLLIIPNFRPIEHSSELLSSPRMVELAENISDPKNSTIVIFDLPPMLDADDMLAFSPQFDALLMVVAQGETRQADLFRSFEMLEDIDVLGVVLNKSRGGDDAPSYY